MPIARRLGRTVIPWVAAVAATLVAQGAAAEVYFSDATVEVSGTGSRSFRNCNIVLKPSMALGDDSAPRISLDTSGQTRLVINIDNSGRFQNTTIVQDNTRKPFVSVDVTAVEQFRNNEIGKALKSKKLFHITAKNSAGKYVSSRYDQLDFDKILARIETHCPFDAESLMADTGDRERAERALSISQNDWKLIRWALNKKYAGQSNEPDSRTVLSSLERRYVKRYAGEADLPMSQYLTAELSRRLISEGQTIQRLNPTPSPPAYTPPPPRPTYWNSVASGIWRERGVWRVAVGYSGRKTSKWEAE